MKKAPRTDKKLRARKYRELRISMAQRMGRHDRWSEKPEHMARSRAFISATKHSLERVLENDDVFEAYCARLEQAILARKRIR